MAKTTVQQLMSELEELHPELFNIYTPKGREFVNHFHKYLELEKQQIEQAYEKGCDVGCDIGSNYDYHEGNNQGYQYYEKTYGGNNG